MTSRKFIFALIAGALGTPTVSTAKPSERELAGLRAARHQEHTLEKTIANLRRPSSSSLSFPSTNSSLFLIFVTLCVVAGSAQANSCATCNKGQTAGEKYFNELIRCRDNEDWYQGYLCMVKAKENMAQEALKFCEHRSGDFIACIEKTDKGIEDFTQRFKNTPGKPMILPEDF